MSPNLEEIATTLDHAQITATETPQLEEELSLADAYAVQKLILDKHLARGERHIGPKLGFTSKAKMDQMGVHEIIVGFLTDAMDHPATKPLSLKGLVHPRIEPELVFRLAGEVTPHPEDDAESLADRLYEAVTHVAVGMEVIDSRYHNFKFSLADVIADNTSAAHFIHGRWVSFPREISGLDMQFLIDGHVVEQADTNAILGDPKQAFPQLAHMMLTYGITLPKDSVILAGSMSPAAWLKPGQHVEVRVASFEPLAIDVTA